MKSVDFLRPRLVGARFEGHAIPLELLKDLAVLNEMVIEVAKVEFLKDFPDRKRSPRGFTDGIELRLTGIEEGSAVPVIGLIVAATTLFPVGNESYFERARDAIVSAVAAAEQNRSVTEHLPEKTLSYFDRLGRSLREGESIELSTPARSSPATLTKETRRKLLLASTTVKELTEETSVRGAIPEVDQDEMTFEIQLYDGRKIKAPIAAQHRETILEAFNGYRTGMRVLFQGIGRFTRTERLLAFESIEHVSMLDPLDIPSRIDELRLLKSGWLEGHGAAPLHRELNWLSQSFAENFPEESPYPYLYPTPEGGVRAEWSLAPHEVTLEVDLATHRGSWHHLDTKADVDTERDLNLDQSQDWSWISRQLAKLAGGAT